MNNSLFMNELLIITNEFKFNLSSMPVVSWGQYSTIANEECKTTAGIQNTFIAHSYHFTILIENKVATGVPEVLCQAFHGNVVIPSHP